MLRHYTDIDLTPYDNEDGWYQIYDMFDADGARAILMETIEADYEGLMTVYERLRAIVVRLFEHEHSLSHRACLLLDTLLTLDDLDDSLAKAQDINQQLIDAFDALQKEQSPGHKLGGNILSFAKKDHKKMPN